MKLSKREADLLQTFVSLANKLLANGNAAPAKLRTRPAKRRRRSREEAAKVKQDIIAGRAKGIPVKKLSEKYSVTPAYIYQVTGPVEK
ncbi:MAG: hypothetical protein U1E46_00600 [Hyphomicrobiales bacterium]